MRIRRKANRCLNCNSTLDGVYNYCPNCGQENNNNDVSFSTLFKDYLSNYFAYDSKFVRTIKPFFLKPGFLTIQFNEGKRVAYAHPLRLYFLTSLLFFFVFGLIWKQQQKKDQDALSEMTKTLQLAHGISNQELRSFSAAISESSQLAISRALAKQDTTDLQALRRIIDEELRDKEKKELRMTLGKDALKLLGLGKPIVQDSTVADKVTEKVLSTKEMKKNTGIIFVEIDWALVDSLRYDSKYTEDRLLEMMELDDRAVFPTLLAKQSIRIYRDGNSSFQNFIFKNIPLMMLVFIPIFALVLLLMYRRRKIFYIKHVVHALHLHAFGYIALLLAAFFDVILPDDDFYKDIFMALFILGIPVCFYTSFLRVYGQSWGKTLVKFVLSSFSYFVFIFVFLILEMALLFFLY